MTRIAELALVCSVKVGLAGEEARVAKLLGNKDAILEETLWRLATTSDGVFLVSLFLFNAKACAVGCTRRPLRNFDRCQIVTHDSPVFEISHRFELGNAVRGVRRRIDALGQGDSRSVVGIN